MPDAAGLELIRGEIEGEHPGAVLDSGFERGEAALVVDPDRALDVLRWLHDSPGQEYRFLSSLHAADYLPSTPRFAVHYELLNRDRVERLRVKALLADPASPSAGGASGGVSEQSRRPVLRPSDAKGDASASGEEPSGRSDTPPDATGPAAHHHGLPEIDSCVELFPTANFQEREAFDFFGIVFRGHPDLTRILLPDDYVGWPQRRDFPVGGEPVTFTYDERDHG